MFSFSFASKMLNTIMGTEEGQPGAQPGGPPQGQPQGQPPGMRPMGGAGFPPMRPGGPGQPNRPPGFPGPTPTFSGPRPTPGARAGPPSFGAGPPRPTMGGVGTPHRFNGPQPLPGQQPGPGPGPMGPRGGPPQSSMPGGRPQGPPGMMGPGPGPGMGQGQGPGPMRPRGPGPGPGPGGQMGGGMGPGPGPHPGPGQGFPPRPPAGGALPPSAGGPAPVGGVVPEVDLSHLSAEERAMIESVMAKAQQLDQGPPAPPPTHTQEIRPGPPHHRMQRPETQIQPPPPTSTYESGPGGMQMQPQICPLCRHRDVSGKTDGIPGQECVECRLVVCNKCGGMSPNPETKRSEWACGNCINNRRQRMNQYPHGPQAQPQQMSQGPRPYGQPPSQQMEVDGSRRGSGGMPSEREFAKESKVGSWSSEGKQRRRPSFEEIFSPEKSETSEPPLHDLPPVDLDFTFQPEPPPDHDLSHRMSTPHTASASQATPSFVVTNNKLHSRSISIDKPETQDLVLSTSSLMAMKETSIDEVEEEPEERRYLHHHHQPPPPPPPQQPPPPDPKTSALMEELTRLQSAVDSTLKRATATATKHQERQSFQPFRSPSPSPSPVGSPLGASPSGTSKLLSPDIQSPPESPLGRGGRKAIVLKEHDLVDDYKSSSEEENGGESDESDDGGRKGSGGDLYYDHSPGEVYTIPEEEDEGGSPTGGDLVTSLAKHQGGLGFQPTVPGGDLSQRRRGPQDMMHQQQQQQQQQHGMRPQLRPQRSLDNRLPSAQHQQMEMNKLDQQGNLYGASSGVSSMVGGLEGQTMNQNLMTSKTASSLPMTMTTSGPGMFHSQQQQELQHQQNQQQPLSQQGMQVQQSQIPPQQTQQQVQQGQAQTFQQQPNQFQQMQPGQGQLPHQMGQPPQQQQQTPYGQDQLAQQQQQHATSQPQPHPPEATLPTEWNANVSVQSSMGSTAQQFQRDQAASNLNQAYQTSSSPFMPLSTSPQPQAPFGSSQQQQQQTYPQGQIPQTGQGVGYTPQGQLGTTGLQGGPQPPQFQQQGTQPAGVVGGALQGSQLQQLQAQQAQANQLAQQQQWLQQADQALYEQQRTGSLGGTLGLGQQQFPDSQSPVPPGQGLPDQYTTQGHLLQSLDSSQQQYGAAGGGGAVNVNTSQAGPGAKSISGLLADFSRALGLGSTSPRPSPSDDKSLAFPIPSSTVHSHMQPLSSFDSYQAHQIPSSISHQHSAFASIQDNYQRGVQGQVSGVQQFPSSQQQYGITSPQPMYVSATGTGQVGVSVIGSLSPAQAQMYQQQMAMQHQQQHMKKRGRSGHLSNTGEREMGQASTVLIGGQSLAMTPGIPISALTPAVVTSLGTFIGGGPTLLGTQLLQQPLIGTPVGTPRGVRDLPGAGDSSDTMSETDSQKSLRMRRKLPCLPPDQEAAPMPTTKKRERHRSQENYRSSSPMRLGQSSDMTLGRQYPFSSLSLSRPSASESNLRKISMSVSDPVPRPGSALGLLQASSVVSSMGGKPEPSYSLGMNSTLFSSATTFPGMRASVGYPTDLTTTTSVLAGLYPSHKTSQESWNANLAELAACLPPDLRHLLNKGTGTLDHDISAIASGLSSSGLGDSAGGQMPSYIRSLREQLQEERRQLLTEERRRLEALRERDRELGARLDAVTGRASDSLRSRTELGISRSAGASPLLSRKLKSHRRQLSDPKLSLPFSPIQEDGDNELQDFDRVSAGILRPPYKSYEYESLEDGALRSALTSSATSKSILDWDHSQSYLTSSWAQAGGVLRETAINSMDQQLGAGRYLSRRNSEGDQSSSSYGTSSRYMMSSSTTPRRHHSRKHRKSRSWHPSPYVSEEEEEEEEDLMSREDKKARIKAEIARRRQQMQERGGGHMRDPTDLDKHSVLKSVDQLIRDQYGRYEPTSSSSVSYGRSLMYGAGGGGSYMGGVGGMGGIGESQFSTSQHLHHHHSHLSHHHQPHHQYPSAMHGLHHVVSPVASEEDRSIERIASTFGSAGEYYYDPMGTDSESIGSELGAPMAMPILPDMPTRSRNVLRRLEDLGANPLEGSRGSAGVNKGEFTGRDAKLSPFSGHHKRLPALPPPKKGGEGKGEEPVKRPLTLSSRKVGRDETKLVTEEETMMAVNHIPEKKKGQQSSGRGRGRKWEEKRLPSPVEPLVPKLPIHSEGRDRYAVKRYLVPRNPKDSSIESNGLGVKVVGGKEIAKSNGRLTAYVAKLFPEKLDGRLGDVREGDAVLEWNGIWLENKTFEEVASIIQGNLTDEVELVISEFNVFTNSDGNGNEEANGFEDSRSEKSQPLPEDAESLKSGSEKEIFGRSTAPRSHRILVTRTPSSESTEASTSANQSHQVLDDALSVPEVRKRSTCSLPPNLEERERERKLSANISVKSVPSSRPKESREQEKAHRAKKGSRGYLELQICHDGPAGILYVTIIKAKLAKREDLGPVICPYVNVFLLPDRIVENQRRTRHVQSLTPAWNQTMVYPNVTTEDLKTRYLEMSVKHFMGPGQNPLLGQVVLYLSDGSILEEQPNRYSLTLEDKPIRRGSQGQRKLVKSLSQHRDDENDQILSDVEDEGNADLD